jgi:hypothetical protein
MQGELDALQPDPPIVIRVINMAAAAGSASLMAENGDLPLLQDTMGDDVWGSWGATWRDLQIVDGCNELVAIYNLTEHNLFLPTNYDELKNMLLAASAADGS